MADFKEITLNIASVDRKFRIGRFNATDGSYILFKVSSLIGPLFKDAAKNDDFSLSEMLALIGKIPKDDFGFMQKQALMICQEVLPQTAPQVMNADGTYGVIGIEKDTINVLKLTMHALFFNLRDFFGEKGLGDILKSLLMAPQK